ncbi:MAG: hypothetical protein PUP91_10550 [Rhizonema sp. PD37]|nr:hypothetical protein [Rhizonema sp. PD37]
MASELNAEYRREVACNSLMTIAYLMIFRTSSSKGNWQRLSESSTVRLVVHHDCDPLPQQSPLSIPYT